MEKVAHLYKITDRITGHHYIGKHNGRCQNGYWGSGKAWKARVKKHGVSNLDYQVLAIASAGYILELERRYVSHTYLQANPLCMNLMQGGYGIEGHTQETLNRISAKLRGKPSWNVGIPMSDEAKQKLRISKRGTAAPNKGKPMSEAAKSKLSAAKKGKVSPTKGKPKSAEQRAKISATLKGTVPWNKGIKLPEDTANRLRTQWLGRTHTEETKQKMRAAHAARKAGVKQ